MSRRLDFSLATQNDEAELRALLRRQPLPGWANLSFEREPDYFAAKAIEGERYQVMLVREHESGELVAFCSRATRRVFIDGEIQNLAYLGQLRSIQGWQNSYRTYLALRKGFSTIRNQLRDSDELPFDITSILGDNAPAKRILGTSLPGIPHYQRYSGFNTLVYRSGNRRNIDSEQVKSGMVAGLSAISHFLQNNYQKYQFSPVWDESALKSAGLAAEDFLLLYKGSSITACVAIWDQRAYKQTIVRAYKKPLELLRPLVNLAAPVLDLPSLSPVGKVLNQAWLSHLACDEDAPESLELLLNMAFSKADKMGLDQLILGLSDGHPMLKAAQQTRRHLTYRSDLYLIQWDTSKIGRSPKKPLLHVEVATL